MVDLHATTVGVGNFFTAIVGAAKFVNLTYHRKVSHFATKCREFEYFYALRSK